MKNELECPRCRVLALPPARRRGRCTSCGAPLVSARSVKEESVRTYLYGAGATAPRPAATHSPRGGG